MNNNVFSFRKVTYEEILNEINSLDTSKSTQSEDIPFKIIKDNADIFANFILQNFNRCIIDGKFPDHMNALNLIFDYLTGRKQRVKINSSFSSYLDIFQGIPQEWILGPLLFNLCDLFLFIEEADIMSYADDSTPYVCSENIDVTLEKLEEVGKVLFEWFSNNFLKANADKFNQK